MNSYKVLYSFQSNIKVTISLFYLFSLLAGACPALGQGFLNKEYVDIEWSQPINLGLSPNGSWSVYKRQYRETDTLVLQHTQSKQTFKIPKGTSFDFTNNESWFFAMDAYATLYKIDLQNKQQYTINKVTSYNLSPNHTFAAVLFNNKTLCLTNLVKNTNISVENITEYFFSKDEKSVYIIKDTDVKKSVEMFPLTENGIHKVIAQNPTQSYKKITTNKSQNSLAFFQAVSKRADQKNSHKLIVYTPQNRDKQLHELNPGKHIVLKGKTFDSILHLVMTQDAKTVFFKLMNPVSSLDRETVEVWDTKDKWIYPKKRRIEKQQNNGSQWYAWNLKRDKIIQLEDEIHAKAIVLTKTNQVLRFQRNTVGNNNTVSISLIDVTTEVATPVVMLNQQYAKYVKLAPNGKYIQYFKERHWWVYDIHKNTHANLTQNLGYSFYQSEYDFPGSKPPYGSPGWSNDSREILLYDQYDIWTIAVNDLKVKKLTNGRKKNISFRFYDSAYPIKLSDFLKHKETPVFNLKNEYILKATGKKKESGYFKLRNRTNVEEIVFDNAVIDQLKKSSTNDVYTYRKQNFDKAPALLLKEEHIKKKIYQSNPVQLKLDWGTSELIHYKDRFGDTLQAALIYPANYNPDIKYPMVVHIYQKKSNELHHFVVPSYYNYDGFNASNLALNGFFVLLPDINYKIGKVGKSALDCVTSAVEKIKEMNLIHENKIGLMGMSFGGYQTAYIITQTDMFSAAVIGVAPTNLISKYHSVSFAYGIEGYKSVENLQYRMGTSYYNNPEIYLDNSPLHHAQNINTPVLQWSGKRDKTVHWMHNFELHMALRRLSKTGQFILYPNETHHLEKPENQKHLTLKIHQWFTDYLKQ